MEIDRVVITCFIIILCSVCTGAIAAHPPDTVPPNHSNAGDNRGADLCIDTFGVTVGCDLDDRDGNGDDDGEDGDETDTPSVTPTEVVPSTPTTDRDATSTEPVDENTDTSDGPDTTMTRDQMMTDADTTDDHEPVSAPTEASVSTQTVPSDTETSVPSTSSNGSTTNASQTPSDTGTSDVVVGDERNTPPQTTVSTTTTETDTDTNESIDDATDRRTDTPSQPSATASFPLLPAIGGIGVAIMAGAAYSVSYGSARSISVLNRLQDGVGQLINWIGQIGWIIGGETDDGEILLNSTSMEMLRTIESQPGVTPSEVADALDVSITTVYYSAGKLVENDLIVEEKRYGNRRYFTDEFRGDENRIERALWNMPTMTESVLQTVHESYAAGGVSNQAIAQRINRDPSTVTHHINRLEENGLVDRRDDPDGEIAIDNDVMQTLDEFYK